MARVILFGGGDGGGIIIGPDGIKPIPPWDPEIARGLRSIAALTQAESARFAKVFAAAAEQLATELIPHIVGDAGDIDAESGVLFAGFDGDFTCGSTGKRPLPIPRPKLLEIVAEL